MDLHVQVLREGVDDRSADAVQSTGDGVGLPAELAAGVQGRHDRLDAGDSGSRVLVDGYPASVVLHPDRAILVQGDPDGGAVSGHELVHGVVDDFVDEVVQASLIGASDVHAGTAADSLHPFEHLDVCGGILVYRCYHRKLLRPPSSAYLFGNCIVTFSNDSLN